MENNPNTVVIVTSGSGIKMTDWNDKARAIIYAWYGGQIGNKALAEIIAGKTNPSGKLPITIEKDFKDSPGYGYIPEGESLYTGWGNGKEKEHPIFDINYTEGIFIGYRWYERKRSSLSIRSDTACHTPRSNTATLQYRKNSSTKPTPSR